MSLGGPTLPQVKQMRATRFALRPAAAAAKRGGRTPNERRHGDFEALPVIGSPAGSPLPWRHRYPLPLGNGLMQVQDQGTFYKGLSFMYYIVTM